jgi:Cys-tRNA(Pro)/Cys-tRNA(Cys) deacylase
MNEDVNKLNSMRLLEAQNVAYEVFTYDDKITDGVSAAEAMGQPPALVYKTLVVQLNKGGEHALVMIPSDQELDLKRFARSIGAKKASMTTKRGAEAATGLKTGGIGALALGHKRWGAYLDEAAQAHEAIFVNAGQRGVNLKVKVDDLIKVLNAKVVSLTGEASTETSDSAESDNAE